MSMPTHAKHSAIVSESHRPSVHRGLVRIGMVLIATIVFGLLAARADEPPRFQLSGNIADDRGEPVAGAIIRVQISPQGFGPTAERFRQATTDAEGRYLIELPQGHATCLVPQLPGGFMADGLLPQAFATTRKQPVHQLDFKARRGPRVTIKLGGEEAAKSGQMVYVTLADKPGLYFLSQPMNQGQVGVTLPAPAGKFQINLVDQGAQPLAACVLDTSAGFDPQRVRQAVNEDSGKSCELIDAENRPARVEGAGAESDNGQLVLRPALSPSADRPTVRVSGTVVNSDGKPVVDAEVHVGYASKSGSHASPTSVRTATDGRFAIDALMANQSGSEPSKIFLIVTHDDLAGAVTNPRRVARNQQALEFPEIHLAKGHSTRVRLVDKSGEPLVGAWIEAGEPYLSAAHSATTDADGRCELRHLPANVVRVSAHFGQLTYFSKLVVGGDSATSGETTLTLRDRKQEVVQENPIPDPPRVGTEAPELDVATWTDGKSRKLADLRGKIVVLDFWGVWCGPCVNAIPSIKQLASKYADRQDVVFLGIHSAGTELDQVKKLQSVREWTLPTALDRGGDINAGSTTRAYGVRGWPTTVIIDREGKVAYNSNLEKWNALTVFREVKRIEKAMGLPPEKPDASPEEQRDRSNAMSIFHTSELIDRVLGGK